jgi:hypothetical protein
MALSTDFFRRQSDLSSLAGGLEVIVSGTVTYLTTYCLAINVEREQEQQL